MAESNAAVGLHNENALQSVPWLPNLIPLPHPPHSHSACCEITAENGSATTPEGISKTAFAQLLTACSDACITLCRQNTHTNDILSWCLYENLILLTFQHGEASEH